MAFFCPLLPARRTKMKTGQIKKCGEMSEAMSEECRSLSMLKMETEAEGDPLDIGASLVVTSDFLSTVDDEVGVSKGDIVRAVYQEDEWVYVVCEDGSQGFIPLVFCELRTSADKRHLDGKKRSNFYSTFKQSLTGSLRRNRPTKSQEFQGKESLKKDSCALNVANHLDHTRSPKAAENVSNFMRSLEQVQLDIDDVGGTSEKKFLLSSGPKNQSFCSLTPMTTTNRESEMGGLSSDRGSMSVQNLALASVYDCESGEGETCPLKKETEYFWKCGLGYYVTLYPFAGMAEDDLDAEKNELILVLNRDDPDWYWGRSMASKREGFLPSNYLVPIKDTDHGMEEWSEVGKKSRIGDSLRVSVTRDFVAERENYLDVQRGEWVYCRRSSSYFGSPHAFVWAYSPRHRTYGFVPSHHLQFPPVNATVL